MDLVRPYHKCSFHAINTNQNENAQSKKPCILSSRLGRSSITMIPRNLTKNLDELASSCESSSDHSLNIDFDHCLELLNSATSFLEPSTSKTRPISND